MAPRGPEVQLITTASELQTLLDIIDNLDKPAKLSMYRWKPAPLCIDLQGVELNGQYSISLIPLFIHDDTIDTIFIIDIFTLGAAAFNTANEKGTTLKQILESESIPKMGFDIADGTNVLQNQFGVRLAFIQDLQVQELIKPDKRPKAPQPKGKKKGRTATAPKGPIALLDCVQNVTEIDVAERRAMVTADDAARKLFDPTWGGSDVVFNERPLREELIQYCADSVRFLPEIYERYKYNHRPPFKRRSKVGSDQEG